MSDEINLENSAWELEGRFEDEEEFDWYYEIDDTPTGGEYFWSEMSYNNFGGYDPYNDYENY